ncbi:MAG: hypothetical protein FJW23_07075 [Acidimicrobiia bacterium]|nr:hypothetical protein [Acidimicrobiia bacterium]
MTLSFLTRHFVLKCASVGMAAMLWFVVSGQQVVERVLRVPLEYTNLPSGLETVGEAPTVVDVRVRGSSAAVARVAPGELVAVLDLQTARPGHRLFHLTAVDVRGPFGVEILQVTPSNVSIQFEPSLTRSIPVVPAIDGRPADGYEVASVSATPSTVEVVGPASALQALTQAITEPVSVAGAATQVRELVNVGVPDMSVRLTSPQRSMIVVELRLAHANRIVEGVAVTARGSLDRRRSMKPERVAVSVNGPRDTVDSLAPEAIEVFVDVDGLESGRYTLPVRAVVSPPVSVLKVEPEFVQVSVR